MILLLILFQWHVRFGNVHYVSLPDYWYSLSFIYFERLFTYVYAWRLVWRKRHWNVSYQCEWLYYWCIHYACKFFLCKYKLVFVIALAHLMWFISNINTNFKFEFYGVTRYYIAVTNLISIKLNNNYIKGQNSELSFNIKSNASLPLNYVLYINTVKYESSKFILVLQRILLSRLAELHNLLNF